MSIIRASENPEGLYIIGSSWDGREVAQIFHNFNTYTIDWTTFERFFLKIYHGNFELPFSYKGLELHEFGINKYTIEYVENGIAIWEIEDIFETTLMYIANGVYYRWKLNRKVVGVTKL